MAHIAKCVACGEPRPARTWDDRCESCMLWAATDAEHAERLVRDLKAMPSYNGWTVAWEYPGYIEFRRAGSCSVLATPDYHERGRIAVEVSLANGSGVAADDIAWPREGRTPEGFMALLRPVLDRVAPLDGSDGSYIFEAVMEAMQDAEERGGPDGARYVALMESIAREAQRRADIMRASLARKGGAL